jgi:lipoyl(octanoyl) transferase
MDVIDLQTMPYRDAWELQESAHAEVLAGGPARIFLVEHPPVVTFGRRPGQEKNVIATPQLLAARGVDSVMSDRGGDVTFHGPGQLVCYPIIRLAEFKLTVSGYVHLLENAIVDVLAEYGIASCADPAAVGVWTVPAGQSPKKGSPKKGTESVSGDLDQTGKKGTESFSKRTPSPFPGEQAAKVCAIGVRIRRGVTMHGLALNVSTDLDFFNLIVPCGLTGRPVTSLSRQLGEQCPSTADVKKALMRSLISRLAMSGDPASPKDAKNDQHRFSGGPEGRAE